MESLDGKIDSDPGAPGQLPAAEWNQAATELENVILDAGIALSSGDLTQLSKAIANYVSNGFFYTDSGSANAYVLTELGTNAAVTGLRDGMIVEFETSNPNTGASTVVVAGQPSRSILLRGGGALGVGDISGRVKLRYDLANTRFELQDPKLYLGTAATDYLELGTGIIIQWGVSSSLADNASQTLTFATTFPNGAFTFSATPVVGSGTGTSQSASAIIVSTSQIAVSNTGDGPSFQIQYIAIGW